MKKLILILSIVLTLGLINAQGHFEKRFHSRIMEKLELTADQQDKINKIKDENQLKAVDLRAKIEKIQIEVRAELNKKSLDESAIRSLISEKEKINKELKEMRLNSFFSIYKVLNEKQQEIWKKSFPARMEREKMIRGKHNFR